MRAVVQRVSEASVTVGEKVVGKIGVGLLVLVGVHRDDTAQDAAKLADRLTGIRIFPDNAGKMNLSLLQVKGSLLAVPNFTLYGDVSQRRPSFGESAPFEVGKTLFEKVVSELRKLGVPVETGEFGTHMQVKLLNDGPVTLLVDTR
jgi:D-tyrosyl-tRNA(Tyr) deacylase